MLPFEEDPDDPPESSEQIVDVAYSTFIESLDTETQIDEQRVQGGRAIQIYRGWGLDNIMAAQ